MKKSWGLILSCIVLIMLLASCTSKLKSENEEGSKVKSVKTVEKSVKTKDEIKAKAYETDPEAIIAGFNNADLKELLSLYNTKIDGAYAEGFGFNILKQFKKTELEEFIKNLSIYDKEVVEGVLTLLVGEFYIEGEQKKIANVEVSLEKLKKSKLESKPETYVIYEFLAQIKYHASRE